METEAGKEITQNDINRKLFEEITRVGKETRAEMKEFNEKMDARVSKFEEKMDSRFKNFEEKMDTRFKNFEEKMDTRIIRFEDSINLKMNWQMTIFTLVMITVVMKLNPFTPIINAVTP
jgi:hypothetical protein